MAGCGHDFFFAVAPTDIQHTPPLPPVRGNRIPNYGMVKSSGVCRGSEVRATFSFALLVAVLVCPQLDSDDSDDEEERRPLKLTFLMHRASGVMASNVLLPAAAAEKNHWICPGPRGGQGCP